MANDLLIRCKKWFRRARRVIVALVLLATAAVGVGLLRFHTLPESNRYWWPVTAEDWGAWGTWAGAFGAVGAVYFAAKSIRHSIDAQRGTERELKADRKHDQEQRAADRAEESRIRAADRAEETRIRAADRAEESRIRAADRAHDLKQRDEERQLVREDRLELKKDADQLAKQRAGQLALSYAPRKPHDREYAVKEREYFDAQSEFEAQSHGQQDEWQDPYINVAYVVITNHSRDDEFRQLSLCLNEPIRVAGTRLFRRVAPPGSSSSAQLDGEPPEWEPDPSYSLAFPEAMNMWDLGQLGPGRELMLEISFKTPQLDLDWYFHDATDIRWFVVEYEDSEGRAWVRSTRTRTNDPYRRTPDWEAEIDRLRAQP